MKYIKSEEYKEDKLQLQRQMNPDIIQPIIVTPKNDKADKNDRYIPKAVKREVWRRDDGKCVQCGTKEKLEFDHIIPIIKGGSNTERNVQLLCEICNRKKSAMIH